jgi:hypothetical protein
MHRFAAAPAAAAFMSRLRADTMTMVRYNRPA